MKKKKRENFEDKEDKNVDFKMTSKILFTTIKKKII